MKPLLTLIVLLGFTSFYAQAGAGQTQFFESIQDLPLMPGLIERADATLVFDKPEGRVIESVAEMQSLSDEQVRQYYASSLPQFGWEMAGEDIFVRQNEALQLAFESDSGYEILRIMISPR